MTKAIESLKTFPSKEDILHQTIADTYFYKKPRRKKYHKASGKELRTFSLAIFSLAAIVSLLLLFFIASYFFNIHYNNYLRNKIARSKVITLIDNGNIDKEPIRRIEFRGYAKNKSKLSIKPILFSNPKKYNWADLSIDFKFPIDLSDRILLLSVKGKIGGEKINIIMRDVENRSFIVSDIYLTSSWKTETIPLDNIKKDIDLSATEHLRIESSFVGEPPREAGNSPVDMTMYIKDVKILKRPRSETSALSDPVAE